MDNADNEKTTDARLYHKCTNDLIDPDFERTKTSMGTNKGTAEIYREQRRTRENNDHERIKRL